MIAAPRAWPVVGMMVVGPFVLLLRVVAAAIFVALVCVLHVVVLPWAVRPYRRRLGANHWTGRLFERVEQVMDWLFIGYA